MCAFVYAPDLDQFVAHPISAHLFPEGRRGTPDELHTYSVRLTFLQAFNLTNPVCSYALFD